MTALSDAAKLITTWGENAVGLVRSCASAPALTDWIVDNRYRLHDLEAHALASRQALQLVINERYRELG